MERSSGAGSAALLQLDMPSISLKEYLRELSQQVAQLSSLEDAIEHLRYVLRSMPRNLEAQRLLARAYMETKRLEQAARTFQKVLGTAPDDFVSWVGLALIADAQGKQDLALANMQRAYDLQPANAATAAELRRMLRARGAGGATEPTLTAAGLARQDYIAGRRVQAITAMNSLLYQDPDRLDVKMLLARAYAENGQRGQASRLCAEVLRALPYCLDANKLMLGIAPAAEDAPQYRQRIREVDPYAVGSGGSVPDAAVMMERFEPIAPSKPLRAADSQEDQRDSERRSEDLPDFLRARPSLEEIIAGAPRPAATPAHPIPQAPAPVSPRAVSKTKVPAPAEHRETLQRIAASAPRPVPSQSASPRGRIVERPWPQGPQPVAPGPAPSWLKLPRAADPGGELAPDWLQPDNMPTSEMPMIPDLNEEDLANEVLPWTAKSGDLLPPEPANPFRADPSLISARQELLLGKLETALSAYTVMIRNGIALPELIQDLTTASQRHEDEYTVWKALGDAHMRAGDLDAALTAYTRAEELLR